MAPRSLGGGVFRPSSPSAGCSFGEQERGVCICAQKHPCSSHAGPGKGQRVHREGTPHLESKRRRVLRAVVGVRWGPPRLAGAPGEDAFCGGVRARAVPRGKARPLGRWR